MSYEVKPLNELLQEKKQQRGGEGAKDVQKPSSAGFRRLRLPKKTEKVALDSVCVELATTAECTRHESTIAARGASQSPDLVQSNETRVTARALEATTRPIMETQPAQAKQPARVISMKANGSAQIVLSARNTSVETKLPNPPAEHTSLTKPSQRVNTSSTPPKASAGHLKLSTSSPAPTRRIGRIITSPTAKAVVADSSHAEVPASTSVKPSAVSMIHRPAEIQWKPHTLITSPKTSPEKSAGSLPIKSQPTANLTSPQAQAAAKKPVGRVTLRRASVASPPPSVTTLSPSLPPGSVHTHVTSPLPPSLSVVSNGGSPSDAIASDKSEQLPALNKATKRTNSDTLLPGAKRPRKFVPSQSLPLKKRVGQMVASASLVASQGIQAESATGAVDGPVVDMANVSNDNVMSVSSGEAQTGEFETDLEHSTVSNAVKRSVSSESISLVRLSVDSRVDDDIQAQDIVSVHVESDDEILANGLEGVEADRVSHEGGTGRNAKAQRALRPDRSASCSPDRSGRSRLRERRARKSDDRQSSRRSDKSKGSEHDRSNRGDRQRSGRHSSRHSDYKARSSPGDKTYGSPRDKAHERKRSPGRNQSPERKQSPIATTAPTHNDAGEVDRCQQTGQRKRHDESRETYSSRLDPGTISSEMIDNAHEWLVNRNLCKFFICKRRGCLIKRCVFSHDIPHDLPDFVNWYCQAEMWKAHVRAQCLSNARLANLPGSPQPYESNELKAQQKLATASDLLKKNLDVGWNLLRGIEKDLPGAALPVSCCEEVITLCGRSSDPVHHGPIALEAFSRLKAGRPHGYTMHDYCNIIALLSQFEMIDDAFKMYARMKESYSPINEVIVDLVNVSRAVDPSRGFTLLQDIEKHSLFRSQTLDQLVGLCVADKNLLPDMCSALQVAKKEKVVPHETTYVTLLSLLVDSAMFDEAFEVLDYSGLKTLPAQLFVGLCQAGCERSRYLKQSIELLFQHEPLRAELPAEVWSELVAKCCESNLLKEASQVYRAARACNVTLSAEAAQQLIGAQSQGASADIATETSSPIISDRSSTKTTAGGSLAQAGGDSGKAISSTTKQSVCRKLIGDRSWGALLEVVMSMLTSGQVPPLDVLATLVTELIQSLGYRALYLLALECIRANVKARPAFYQRISQFLSGWKENPGAVKEVREALNSKKTFATKRAKPSEQKEIAGIVDGNLVCSHWLTPAGCRRADCLFEHPPDLNKYHHSPRPAPQPASSDNEEIILVVDLMKLCAQRQQWQDCAQLFLKFQHPTNLDLPQASMVNKSQWLCEVVESSNVTCGLAFQEFVTAAYQLCPDVAAIDVSNKNSANDASLDETDTMLLAHVGVRLLHRLAAEKNWEEAYTILYSLHSHQIQYLSESRINDAGLSYPGQLSRCRVALLGVQVCAKRNDPQSSLNVLKASDFAASSSSDQLVLRREQEERTAVFEQLINCFLKRGELESSFLIVQQLLEPASGSVCDTEEISRKCASLCAVIIQHACTTNSRSETMAITVHDYMVTHSLIPDGSFAESMYTSLLGLVIEKQRLVIARQIFLTARREHLYLCNCDVTDRHQLTLPAYRLTKEELFLVIEHYLYELADSLQARHSGRMPWSFAVRPILQRRPVILMVQCCAEAPHVPSVECQRCIELVQDVLAGCLPPSLTAKLRAQLEENCHALVLDDIPLVRWFTSNSINPYRPQQYMASQSAKVGSQKAKADNKNASTSPVMMASPKVPSDTRNSPGGQVPAPRSASRPASSLTATPNSTSRSSAITSSKHPATGGTAKKKDTSDASRRSSTSGDSTSPAEVTVEPGATFPDIKVLRNHVAKHVCRRLTRHMRDGAFRESRFKSRAQEMTHTFVSLLQSESSTRTVVNGTALESRIKRFVDEKFRRQ